VSTRSFASTNEFVMLREVQPKEKQQMAQESSKQDRSARVENNDKGWLKEAIGSLTGDDKERVEEQIEGATGRIEDAANSLREGRAREASSALSSGRHRDKARRRTRERWTR
jgi:uncharacterized protein YjbJ (UPF0337 family)